MARNPPRQIPAAYQAAGPRPTRYGYGKQVSTPLHHEEVLASVTGSGTGAWTPHAISVNPGLTGFLPWGAAIARQYEKYHVRRLCFKYVPACGTTTNGTVQVAFDFDSRDATPTTLAEMASFRDHLEMAPYKAMDFVPGLASDRSPTYYTRHGEVPAGCDVKTYDVGCFYWATEGVNADVTVGRLIVAYDIELLTPQPVPIADLAPAGSYRVDHKTGAGIELADILGTAVSSRLPEILGSGGENLPFRLELNSGGQKFWRVLQPFEGLIDVAANFMTWEPEYSSQYAVAAWPSSSWNPLSKLEKVLFSDTFDTQKGVIGSLFRADFRPGDLFSFMIQNLTGKGTDDAPTLYGSWMTFTAGDYAYLPGTFELTGSVTRTMRGFRREPAPAAPSSSTSTSTASA